MKYIRTRHATLQTLGGKCLETPFAFVCATFMFHFVNKPEKDTNEDKLLSLDMGKKVKV